MTTEHARRNNIAQTAKIEQSIKDLVKSLETRALPQAMEEVGVFADEYSERTKLYNDRTGNLRSGYAHVVIPPGDTRDITWHSLDGGGSEPITNDTNEVQLVFGNPIKYAIFQELLFGNDVSIQTFIFLRREFRNMLASKLRAFKFF